MDEGDAKLVEVHRCSQAEAMVIRGLYESHGIPSVLRGHMVPSVHPFSVGAQGEVTILVPERDAPRSRRLLIGVARVSPPPR
jgi:hypothetical protein